MSPVTAEVTEEPINESARLPQWPFFSRISQCLMLPVLIFTLIAFMGRWHWTIELFTHFRLQYFAFAIIVLLLLMLARKWKSAAICLVLVVVNGTMVLPIYLPASQPVESSRSLRILFANLYVHNNDIDSVKQMVKETDPDIILFAETQRTWIRELQELRTDYPYAIFEENQGAFGVSALSRFELERFEVQWVGQEFAVPVIVVETSVDGLPLTLYGAHVESPGTRKALFWRTQQLQELARLVASNSRETAVIGDLNLTPWSPYFGDFLQASGLRDSRQGFGIQTSWPSDQWLLRIPIDHCLVSEGVVIKRREILPSVGSDHYPLLIELAIAKKQ
jgi:endonuclease/exonuclease/phosphatase (EEP) superfamily protein YafD